MSKFTVFAAVTLALMSPLAFAAPSQPLVSPPAVVQKFLAMSHGQVKAHFATPLQGLEGWYIKAPSAGPQGAVVYTDKGYAFIGALINPQGENLSAAYTKHYAPKPQLSKVVAELSHAKHLIGWGNPKAPVHLYAFEDANCIFCNLFYTSAKPYVESGKAYVQVVPVAFLKPSSPGKAAAILSAKNPENAYEADENRFNRKTEEGAIQPIPVSAAMQAILARHGQWLMRDLQSGGTPTLLYRQGGHWKVMKGYSATLVGQLVKEAK